MERMKRISIEKVVLNMGCGTKVKIDDAKKILETITNRKAVITKTEKRSTFGVPKNNPIGCKITVRDGSVELLKRMLEAKEFIKKSNFDNNGNFSFGIKEYIDIQGIEYEPKIGILGFDVCVTLERPGYRVKRKSISSKVGKSHVITKEEAIKFVSDNFKVGIE